MKHCPLCSTPLNRTLLEANLPAFSCSNCHGLWVSANEYLT
ncbi:MAG: zf-TFIIB domain-containing protein, partial [Anaerolineales bacterium]|nr:zf-TFIIB domain-containing protein [Anaerolineales bacterium]